MIGRRCPVFLGLSLGVALACAGPARSEERSAALARTQAARWLELQRSDGSFEDRLRPWRYGESMLGLALLQTGLRDANRRQVDAGLAGLWWVMQRPERRDAHPSVFETFALASAYNLARRRLAADPVFRFIRPAWERWLEGARPVLLGRRLPFHNHHVVEAAAALELTSTGLTSSDRGTVLGDPARSRRLARDLVNRLAPSVSRRRRTRVAGRAVALLVDEPNGHPAYQGLTLAFYGRALELLGSDAAPAARAAFVRAARASVALAAPDGDVAFSGRSQEQSWSLSFTAFGALKAASMVRKGERGALTGLARRALDRLGSVHPVRDFGLAITPALGRMPVPRLAGLDPYADATGFGGLTLLGLVWAAEEPGETARRGPVRRGIALLRAARGDLAVVRTRRHWWVVRRTVDPDCGLRCDFGLVAFKARRGNRFEDVMSLRPRGWGTAGPVLLRGRRRLEPAGLRIGRRSRSVIVRARLGRRLARFRFAPGRCGPVMSWPARRGDRFEYSLFLPAGAGLRRTRGGVAAGRMRLRSRSRLRVTVTGEHLASASEPDLTRAVIRLRAKRSGRLRLEHCGG